MPRARRLEAPDVLYHVFNRGNRREIIFRDEDDHRFFEQILFSNVERAGITLYAWCLMPNHFHLLLRTPEANLAVFMRRLLTRYALAFNRRHDLVGHVFQGRYKARLCEDDRYFLALVRYIHRNPIAGKKPLVHRLSDWPWSSHRLFEGHAAPPAVAQAHDETLSRFGARPRDAISTYNAFLFAGDDAPPVETVKGRFLGSETFVERMKLKGRENIRSERRGIVKMENAAALLERACEIGNLDKRVLLRPGQNRGCCRWREAICVIGRQLYRFPTTEIAAALRRSPSAVSQIIARARAETGEIGALRAAVRAAIKVSGVNNGT
jgi:REP element-mobilizing transposase RayT